MRSNRLRTTSENFLGTESSSQRVITSSWEVRKTHYGHVRASPSPNRRLCQDTPGTAAMQTFHVTDYKGFTKTIDQKNKTFKTVQEFINHFVDDPSKRRNIHKILVATNGIAAVKCIISIRKFLMQWFKDDHIIKFICVTTDQEIQSKAGYLKMADNIVISPAGANTNNYANVDEIVEQAVRCGADAVWAGWGHASENPRLPEELSRHNISFIGPPSNAMFALGDKIASTIIAQTVDIPTIEWSGSGIVAPEPDPSSSEQEMNIPEHVYRQATVCTVDEGLKVLKEKHITYPIMIKASEGGGGKGIRKCTSDQEFNLNFRRVQAEVPGSPIFLMKCMTNARHIEVQLIADQYGNVISLFTRDCSIQRRCQKIIEEAPASIAPAHILRQMCQDAVNIAKKVGYVSAGTVEYMYLPDTEKYYFLELNPRLQVEHPCTEMITNVCIPAVQLQIAMGVPLHRIVEIRLLYGLDRYGTSPLPEEQLCTETDWCVIAARITSEDPAEGFRPASGSVEVLNFQSNQNVWGYFSVAPSGKVHEFADSQFGHLFAKGTTRHEAVSALQCALKELELRATFQSQVNYLVGLLRDPEFESNSFHTGWLDERIAAKVQSAPEHPLHVIIAVGATVIGHARMSEVFSKFQNAICRGQILPTSELTETWEFELVHNSIKYSVLVNRYSPQNFLVCVNNIITHTTVRQFDTGGDLLVTYDQQSFQCYLDEEVDRFKVSIGQTMTIFEKENDPTILRSKNAGRLLHYLKKDGEKVTVGQFFAEMESMKMVIALDVKKVGGTLIQVARPGQVLFPGSIIAKLEIESDVCASRPINFEGEFEQWSQVEERRNKQTRINTRFEQLFKGCHDILDGYSVPKHMYKASIVKLVDDLFKVLDDPSLPIAMYSYVLASVKSRIKNPQTCALLEDLLKDERNFPTTELSDTLETYLGSLNPSEVGMERAHFVNLQKVCEDFSQGLEGHKQLVIKQLLEYFLETEDYFQGVAYEKGVSSINSNVKDAEQAVRMVYSHTKIELKNDLIEELVSRLGDASVHALQPVLKKIANLYNGENEKLALCVRTLLNQVNRSSEYESLDKSLLQLERLPVGSEDISTHQAPYMIFKYDDQGVSRFFVRHLVRDIKAAVKNGKFNKQYSLEKLSHKLLDVIDGACGAIRLAAHSVKANKILNDCNHIFICIEYESTINTEGWAETIKDVLLQQEKHLNTFRVTEVEIVFTSYDSYLGPQTFHATYNNETGAIAEFGFYKVMNNRLSLCHDGYYSRYDGISCSAIHQPIKHAKVQKLRSRARDLKTTYCYDLPTVFGRAVLDIWHEFKRSHPVAFGRIFEESLTDVQRKALLRQDSKPFCHAYEMILNCEQGPINVIRDERIAHKRFETVANDRGMVAWEMDICTPEYVSGRKIVVIANDLTYQAGSFSMKEHRLYYFASKYSRQHKLPRVYVSANSGARIGLAMDVKKSLDVCWSDPERPEEGFQALCLEDSAADNQDILAQIESTKRRDGKVIIDAVIGKEDDIGVENLVGSGLIAGETSAAYQEVPTYCLVTGRAVGIGAYAARLSHRIVQVGDSHLILTGASALNSLLGREIYTSNGQLGGTQIMYHNGVTHSVATSDLEGITKIVRWMTYLTPSNHLSTKYLCDDREREVTTMPSKGQQYDPRDILDPTDRTGYLGLFDKGSFNEILDGWAKTIITARAKLCGQPVGVIAIEPRTISFDIPADPASQDSQTRTVTQAGQVWYPDSAFKTAEAINDFNREGLPLIFLANIRGFSGGQKDMFEMVLKFGACIVDALQTYTQPVIVYIPPYGELRGGAWAVLDTQINPTCITMLADKESRGGVLEPDGMVEIKFRKPDIHALMMKCDSQLQDLKTSLEAAESQVEKSEINLKITKRQELLMPVYRTIAVKFADLHDTTSRMLARNAIHDQLIWPESRTYIHRLLQVQTVRMDMARRYLQSKGIEDITIKKLEEGCQWVDAHLSKMNIEYRQANPDPTSRYIYDASKLLAYSQSDAFKRVLVDIHIKSSSSLLFSNLNVLSDQTRKDLALQLLQSTSLEVQKEFIYQLTTASKN